MIATPPSQSNILSFNELIESTFDSSRSLNTFDLCPSFDADSDDLPPVSCAPRLTRSQSFYNQSTSTSDNHNLHDLQLHCNVAQITLLRSMSDPQFDQSHQDNHTINQSINRLSLCRPDGCHFSAQCPTYPQSFHYDEIESPSDCFDSSINQSLDFDILVDRSADHSPQCSACSSPFQSPSQPTNQSFQLSLTRRSDRSPF